MPKIEIPAQPISNFKAAQQYKAKAQQFQKERKHTDALNAYEQALLLDEADIENIRARNLLIKLNKSPDNETNSHQQDALVTHHKKFVALLTSPGKDEFYEMAFRGYYYLSTQKYELAEAFLNEVIAKTTNLDLRNDCLLLRAKLNATLDRVDALYMDVSLFKKDLPPKLDMALSYPYYALFNKKIREHRHSNPDLAHKFQQALWKLQTISREKFIVLTQKVGGDSYAKAAQRIRNLEQATASFRNTQTTQDEHNEENQDYCSYLQMITAYAKRKNKSFSVDLSKIDSKKIKELSLKSQQYANTGKLADYIQSLEELLTHAPLDHRTRVKLAFTYQQLSLDQKPEQQRINLSFALKHLNNVLDGDFSEIHDSYMVLAYFTRAIIFATQHLYEEAYNDLLKAIDDVEIYTKFLTSDRNEAIIQLFEKLEHYLPALPEMNVLNKKIIQYSKNSDYLYERGLAYLEMNDTQSALNNFRRAYWLLSITKAAKPKFSLAHCASQVRNLLIQQGQIDEAMDWHTKITQLVLLKETGLTAEINASIDVKMAPEFMANWSKSKEKMPYKMKEVPTFNGLAAAQEDFREELLKKGNYLLAVGDFSQAISFFDTAVELLFNEPNIYVTRGVAYRQMGKIAEAKQDFEMALKLDPKHKRARSNLTALSTIDKVIAPKIVEPENEKQAPEKKVKKVYRFNTQQPNKASYLSSLPETEKIQFLLAISIEEEQEKNIKDAATAAHKRAQQEALAAAAQQIAKKIVISKSSPKKKKKTRPKNQTATEIVQESPNATPSDTATASITAKQPAIAGSMVKSQFTEDSQSIFWATGIKFPLFDFEREIIMKLKGIGARAMLGGSSARDRIRGRWVPGSDSDIATSATPEQIRALFKDTELFQKNSKLFVMYLPSGHKIEIYSSTELAHSHQKFMKNCDVTINAFGIDELGRGFTACKDGFNDLFLNPFLHGCVPFKLSYKTDPRRMLRDIYTAYQTEKLIPQSMVLAIKKQKHLLQDVNSGEMNSLLLKLLRSKHREAIFQDLIKYDILPELFPHTAALLIKNKEWIIKQLRQIPVDANPKPTLDQFYSIFIVAAERPNETIANLISNERLLNINFAVNRWERFGLFSKQLFESWGLRNSAIPLASATGLGFWDQGYDVKEPPMTHQPAGPTAAHFWPSGS